MAISIKFELLEIYPQNENDDLKIIFSHENQIIEENAILMLNNIESAIMKIDFSTSKLDTKIKVKLFKGSLLLGSGELPITYAIINKKEESIKKWITLVNSSNASKHERKNSNMAMNLVNTVRIHLKTYLNYYDAINVSISDKSNSSHKHNSNSKQNLNKMGKNIPITSKFIEKNNDILEDSTNNNHSLLENSQNMSLNNMSMTKSTAKKLNERNLNMSCGIIAFNSVKDRMAKQKNSSTTSSVTAKAKYSTLTAKTEKKTKNSMLNKHKVESKNILTETSKHNNDKVLFEDKDGGEIETNGLNCDNLITDSNIDYHHHTKKEEEVKKVEENKCNDSEILDMTSNSFIDQIFQDDSNNLEETSNKLTNCIKEFNLYYTDELMKVLPNDQTFLKFEAKMLADKFFEIQDNYYAQLKELMTLYRNFKKFYLAYNDKFRNINKKHNRIKEALESNHLKTTVLGFINKEEDKRANESLSINRDEMKIYNTLFNQTSQKAQVDEFANIEKENYFNDKEKLFTIAGKIFENPKMIEILSNGQRMIVNRLLNKNDKSNVNVSPNEKTTNISFNNFNCNYNSNNNDTDPNLLILSKSNFASGSKNENTSVFVQNVINTDINEVNSNTQSKSFLNFNIDDKLGESLKKINSKLNKDQLIEFRKISEAIYEYSGSTVIVIVENSEVKVNHNNKLLNLEEFIKLFNRNSIKNGKKESNGLSKLNSRSAMKTPKDQPSASPLKTNYSKLSNLKK